MVVSTRTGRQIRNLNLTSAQQDWQVTLQLDKVFDGVEYVEQWFRMPTSGPGDEPPYLEVRAPHCHIRRPHCTPACVCGGPPSVPAVVSGRVAHHHHRSRPPRLPIWVTYLHLPNWLTRFRLLPHRSIRRPPPPSLRQRPLPRAASLCGTCPSRTCSRTHPPAAPGKPPAQAKGTEHDARSHVMYRNPHALVSPLFRFPHLLRHIFATSPPLPQPRSCETV